MDNISLTYTPEPGPPELNIVKALIIATGILVLFMAYIKTF